MVENSKNSSVDIKSIKEILTLRYDTTLNSKLPKLTTRDFVANKEFSLEQIENFISNEIIQKLTFFQDSKISLALSGGVDSTLVLALIRKSFPNISIKSISIKFAGSIDETETAKKIAQHFDADHTTIYLENFLQELPQAIGIVNRPFWDLHWYYVVKKAKAFSQVLVSGDGGDELFGGYSFRYSKFLSLVDEHSSPLEKVHAYLQCHERDNVPDQDALFEKNMNFSWNDIYKILLPNFDNSLPILNQIFLADYNGKLLYNFSPVNSLIHDHFKINSVTPLLSNELINYVTHIPHYYKYDPENNMGKLPLRKLLKNYDIEKLLSNEKLGFSVNTLNLWKQFAQKICNYYLSNARISQNNLINKDWIEKYLNKNDLDVKYVNKFLGLLSFEIWYRIFITKEMKSTEKLF